jgi:hypothetical protein
VPAQAVSPARLDTDTPVARLARFFPSASPLRLPVSLTRLGAGGGALNENIVIEFGTPKEVLFATALPLEFADELRLENSDRTFSAEVSVVAVQYQSGKTVVAARFLRDIPNWIVKP